MPRHVHMLFRLGLWAALSGMVLGACGGGSSSASSGTGAGAATGPNVAALSVDSFPPYGTDSCAPAPGCGSLNQLYITLRVCPHGSTSNCQTIDHVAVDTGSLGLRLLAASLRPPTSSFLGSAGGLLAALPTITTTSAGGNGTTVTGTLAECAQFGGGYSWGSIRNVDITFVGTNETASNVPMQVMGDMEPAPAACVTQSTTQYALTGSGTNSSGVVTANPLTYPYLGANGLIGVSLFAQDCQPCATVAQPQQGNNTAGLAYVVCADMTGNHCTPTTVAPAMQVVNPITALPTDNNGFLIRMAAVGSDGAASASGSMIFGIGTQANNALGSATRIAANPAEEPGFVYTTYSGSANAYGIFDSGSSLYFFSDASIALCGSSGVLAAYYCPGGPSAKGSANTTLNLRAVVNDYRDSATPSSTIAFSVNNLNNFTNAAAYAYDNVGGPGPASFGYFIWGMPTFYGKTIYFGLADNADGYAAPYYAF